MTRRQTVVLAGGLMVIVGVVVAATAWLGYEPAVPAGAPSIRLAEVRESIAVPSPGTEEILPATTGPGQTCDSSLPVKPIGSLKVCWEVSRLLQEADPTQDYYAIEVDGAIHGTDGHGLRWASIRVAPAADSAPVSVVDRWPDATYDAACGPVSWSPINVSFEFQACGRLRVSSDSPWTTTTIDWLSAGSPLPMVGDRSMALAMVLSVPEGTTPSWDIWADFGD